MRAMSQCHPNNFQWADSKSGLGRLSSSIPREDCGFAGLTSVSQLTLQFCSVKTWQVSTKTLLPWICEHARQSSELNKPDVYGCALWWCNGVSNEVLKTDCEEHTAVRASNHISKPYPTHFLATEHRLGCSRFSSWWMASLVARDLVVEWCCLRPMTDAGCWSEGFSFSTCCFSRPMVAKWWCNDALRCCFFPGSDSPTSHPFLLGK